jgi:3-hydroxyisobutyrate dehydrogenase-like beta-hydroxyacid dehydrogenase
LIEWMDQTRGDLARTLAHVLGSAEALSLSSATAIDPAATGEVIAAAEVGRRILQTVAESYESAADLLHGSADLAT